MIEYLFTGNISEQISQGYVAKPMQKVSKYEPRAQITIQEPAIISRF
jgi:hypothetical protein